jgi:hypothetical protein
MCRPFALRLMALFALLYPAAARGAPVGAPTPARGTVQFLDPSSFIMLMELDFGKLTATGAGTAIVDSATDTVTTTGGVVSVGGSPHAARFQAVSPARNVVKISLPKKAITLTRIGGTETMTLDTWSINGATTRNVVSREQFEFRVAGTLHVNANQAEGIYLGTFDVTINYN